MQWDAFAQAETPELLRCWGPLLGQVEGRSSDARTPLRQQKRAICWPFVKPSDGLEPSTPSLPLRARFACKLVSRPVSLMPARARACSPCCTRLVPA
jgi:hypothetical protein